MITAFLSCLFLVFSFSDIYAGSYTYSPYIDVKELPEDMEDSVKYDIEDVYDEENKIAVPPGSIVEIGVMDGDFPLFTKLKTVIFFSKEQKEKGNLTELLDIDLEYKNIPYEQDGINWTRWGLMYEGYLYANGGKEEILSLEVKQPLKVGEYTYDINDGVVNVRALIVNTTNRLLNNVIYSHKGYSSKKNFKAHEEYVYEYTLEYSEDIGSAEIYDPNVKQICLNSDGSVNNSHAVFVMDTDGNYSYDLKLSDGDDFCITQTAYTLNLKGIEEKFSEEENIQEILGISVLPKTGNYSLELILVGVFLVAFGILCYYFTNEDSIRNA